MNDMTVCLTIKEGSMMEVSVERPGTEPERIGDIYFSRDGGWHNPHFIQKYTDPATLAMKMIERHEKLLKA